MGGHLAGPAHRCSAEPLSNWIQLVLATPVVLWARLAVLRARLAVARHAQSQHVHADRAGHRRRLALQRRRDARAGALPGGVPQRRRRRRGLFRGGGRHHRAGAARPGAGAARARADRRARSARCSTSRRRRRGASAATAATRRSRSTPSQSATACACGRARRFRSTAMLLEGRSVVDESMVTGESMPVTQGAPARSVIGGTLNQTGSFVMRAEKVGARHHAGADRADGGGGAAQPRADPAPRRPGLRLVRAGGDRASRSLAFVAWAVFGPEPRLRLRPGRRGLGADHRLPLRARAGDADVDHGRRRAAARRPAC